MGRAVRSRPSFPLRRHHLNRFQLSSFTFPSYDGYQPIPRKKISVAELGFLRNISTEYSSKSPPSRNFNVNGHSNLQLHRSFLKRRSNISYIKRFKLLSGRFRLRPRKESSLCRQDFLSKFNQDREIEKSDGSSTICFFAIDETKAIIDICQGNQLHKFYTIASEKQQFEGTVSTASAPTVSSSKESQNLAPLLPMHSSLEFSPIFSALPLSLTIGTLLRDQVGLCPSVPQHSAFSHAYWTCPQRIGTAAAFLPSAGVLISFGGCAKFGGSRWLQADLRSIKICRTKGSEILAPVVSTEPSSYPEINTATSFHRIRHKSARTSISGTFAASCPPCKIEPEMWSQVSFPSFSSPLRRHRHSLTTISSNQALLFGGCTAITCYNDVWLLEGPPMKWKRLLPSSDSVDLESETYSPPSARSSHRALVWNFPQNLPEQLDRCRKSSISSKCSSTSSNAAHPIEVSDCIQDAARDAQCNLPDVSDLVNIGAGMKTGLLIFGGVKENGSKCRDAWVLDVDQLRWFNLPLTGLPHYCTDPIIGIWRDSIYACGVFTNEETTFSNTSSDSVTRPTSAIGGPSNEEKNGKIDVDAISIYSFNMKQLKWEQVTTKRQIKDWKPYANVVIGCTWLQCQPPRVKNASNPFPLFYIFDFISKKWTQLNLAGYPNLHAGTSKTLDSFYFSVEWSFREFYRYSKSSIPQLLLVPDASHNRGEAVVVLYGLSHPLWLRHPELIRSSKWERRRLLIWLQWLAQTSTWRSSNLLGEVWRKVLTVAPNDILRCILEFI